MLYNFGNIRQSPPTGTETTPLHPPPHTKRLSIILASTTRAKCVDSYVDDDVRTIVTIETVIDVPAIDDFFRSLMSGGLSRSRGDRLPLVKELAAVLGVNKKHKCCGR